MLVYVQHKTVLVKTNNGQKENETKKIDGEKNTVRIMIIHEQTRPIRGLYAK